MSGEDLEEVVDELQARALTDEQWIALVSWLQGRRADIEHGIEDLDELRPLLSLLDKP